MLSQIASFGQRVIVAAIVSGFVAAASSQAASPWGEKYFPNLPLTTHDGKEVRFFDDLIKGKIVVVNFIYTSCPDTCPLETAQLVKVQEILGDRLGKDVFFYSITLDPEIDTPAVLKAYREKFHAKWTFLTGTEDDIFTLQKKFGLFLEAIRDGLSNHDVSMIIGNQATGRWMKRSPHENPYVLADQIGNWLDGWKRPPELDNYENAPKLRDLPRGEQLFRTRCASCHTVVGKDPKLALGPDLLAVTRRREEGWLLRWLQAPDEMLEQKDPIAMALFEKYNKLAMPNLRLHKEEAIDILKYLEEETKRKLGEGRSVLPILTKRVLADPIPTSVGPTEPPNDVVAVMNAWVRASHPAARMNTGYLTLVNIGSEGVTLTSIQSDVFKSVSVHEMAKVGNSMRRKAVGELVIPPGESVVLKPAGMHLVLKERSVNLTAGQIIELRLLFKSGRQQTISVRVAEG